jgi:hypothetical protein
MELELGTRGRAELDVAVELGGPGLLRILYLDLELDMELDGPTGSNRFDTGAGANHEQFRNT